MLIFRLVLLSLVTFFCSAAVQKESSSKRKSLKLEEKVKIQVDNYLLGRSEAVVTPKANTYKATVNAKKAFRMGFTPNAIAHHHPDGSFSLKEYYDDMNNIVVREKATQARLAKEEVVIRKERITVNEATNSSNRHTRRDSPTFNTDINYPIESTTNLPMGSDAQNVHFSIDLSARDTYIPEYQTSTTSKDPHDQGFIVENSKTSCIDPSTLIPMTLSVPTVTEEVYYRLQLVARYAYDNIFFLAGVQIASSFYFYSLRTATAVSVPQAPQALASLGLAAGFQPVKQTILRYCQYGPGVTSWSGPPVEFPPGIGHALYNWAMENLENLQDLGLDQRPGLLAFRAIADAVWGNDQPGHGAGIAKRSSSVTTSTSHSIMVGGTSLDDYIPPLVWFPVASTPGSSQNSLWILTVQSIIVSYVASPKARIVTRSQAITGSSLFGPVRLDTTRTYIYFTPDRVAILYNGMDQSFVRPPSATNPYWTYRCNAAPTVSFAMITSDGKSKICTLAPSDWYHGLSVDKLGWCNGAIQELPFGATEQLMGLQFFKSFYVVLKTDGRNEQSSEIGLALLKS